MTYHVPADVAWVAAGDFVDFDQGLYLMRVPQGEPVALQGSAAAIWLLASEGADVVRALADLTGEDAHLIEADTIAFIEELVARGLLGRGESR